MKITDKELTEATWDVLALLEKRYKINMWHPKTSELPGDDYHFAANAFFDEMKSLIQKQVEYLDSETY